jgi:ABC-2 type transport system ATP-binding protein
MSIEVSHLLKHYGQQKAVDDLTFTVNKNEIVGFLGPNGAGKSTTLKIATGYIPPTSGSVKVSGVSVEEDPIAVKKLIGYLPEHNPLYLDMFVHEYLRFTGSFYGINGKELRNMVVEVIEMCQLGVEQNKKIGQLSKGYRQRVGLAQALLHQPKVLILDEPTTGLDPNQIVEVRELIKAISKDRTVLFSTHIMQEVQAICDRVIIINDGKMVADDSVKQILTGNTNQLLEVEFETAVDKALLMTFEGVIKISKIDDCKYSLEIDKTEDVRPALMKHISDLELPLIGIKKQEVSMEEVFSKLTQSQQDV